MLPRKGMMPNEFTIGKQPCQNYTPREADIAAAHGSGMANVHECYHGCDHGRVSFCENCNTDHHAGGWDSCGGHTDA